MGKMPSILKITAGIVSFFAVIIFLIYAANYLGFAAGFATSLIMVLPGLIVFFVGCATLATQDLSVFAIPGFGALGIGIAILISEMNAQNIIIDNYIARGWTLLEIQLFFVIIFFLMGAVVAASERL